MIELNIDIFSIILLLGLFQGVFLSILLLIKERLSHNLLGIVLLIMTIQIFDFFSAYSLISLRYPHLIDVSEALGLVLGPFIYILYFFFSNKKYPRYFILHFVPGIIYFINQAFYYSQNSGFKYNSFIISRNIDLPLKNVPDGNISDPLGLRQFGGELISVSLVIYSILIMRELFKIMKLNKNKFWRVDESSLRWLRNFSLIIIILSNFVLLNQLFIKNSNSEYIVATGLTFIIYYTSYHFMRNSFLINESFSIVKYGKSSLPESLRESIKKRLLQHMSNDKAFLDNMFSLKQLSKNITASPNHVSQILNEDFNQSYFEFVAAYRIEEAKKYLRDSEFYNKNIEDVSFSVGYNSKAAFNKAFKKITGKTPLQYKKST